MRRHRPASRFLGQVADAIRANGPEVVLRCRRCGRTYSHDFGSTTMAEKFSRYWSKENGGVVALCPVCDLSPRKTGGPR